MFVAIDDIETSSRTINELHGKLHTNPIHFSRFR